MIVSSRSPDGDSAICPVCDSVVLAEPSLFYSDAPCPSCGSLLWFVKMDGQTLVLRPSDEALKKGLAKILAELLSVEESQLQQFPESLRHAELDSMELVELVMELEELVDL